MSNQRIVFVALAAAAIVVLAVFLVLRDPAATAEPPKASAQSDLVGQQFVHGDLGYLLEVTAVHEGGPEGPWLSLETLNGRRRMQLLVSQLQQLRPLINESRAAQLEELIVRGAPVAGQGDLDLRMYILGTPEQAAIAAATLMERLERDPEAHAVASDLEFMHVKLLGELAAVRGALVAEYVADLQAQRRATPPERRDLQVAPPHEPPMPAQVLSDQVLARDGWHHATVPCVAETWSLGDGGTVGGVFEFHATFPGGAGDWFASMHQLGDDRLDWVVLTQGATGEVRATQDGFALSVAGVQAPLEKRDTMRSETGLVVWMGTAPEDAASSVGHRMPSGAQNIAMVWPYGVAISPGRGGDFDVYGALLSNGARAWAVRVAWEDDD